MPKFQKRPMVVDAFMFDPSQSLEDYPAWAKDAILDGVIYFINLSVLDAASAKVILTGGKVASAYAGDWLAKEKAGTGDGAIYVIEAKVFERLYEPAREEFA